MVSQEKTFGVGFPQLSKIRRLPDEIQGLSTSNFELAFNVRLFDVSKWSQMDAIAKIKTLE